MSGWNVLIVTFEDQQPAAERLRDRLSAAWPAQDAPAFTLVDRDSVEQVRLDRYDAAVILDERSVGQNRLLAVLASLEDEALPVLAVCAPESSQSGAMHFAGALSMSRESNDGALAAALLGLMHRQPEFRRTQQELSIARRFHGGLEGEMARIHEELQLAAMVQRELLPREVPDLHGIRLAAMWRPANYVSGDIYDIVKLNDDHIGVFIADAVGHGVPAALMTMVISRSLITQEVVDSCQRLVPPERVLKRLNEELIRRQGRSTRFATAIYALINCRERTMQLAGAGHPPAIRVRPDGSTDMLETEGGLLGVFQDETYPQIDVDLEVGDRLILYSDGFEQAFPRSDSNGETHRVPTMRYLEEFEQVIRAHEPADMIEQMRARLDAERGSLHQIDDLTLICMKVGALEQAGTRAGDIDCRSDAQHLEPVHPPIV